ncbi:MAG: sensor histidine kinase, partial [Acidobacteriaceae bacterium]|nr:sensor histidine kinase [Acidobacteriaceae bacterium]
LKLIGTCQDITERKQAEQQLKTANAALAQELKQRARTEKEIKALSARLISAQEEERSRLARELHDDLSQQIAAISVAISNLKRAIPSEAAEARSQSERIREKVAHLGDDTRRLSHELHPAILQYLGLEPALREYCGELAALTGIQMPFHSHGSFPSLSPAIALSVYRITQEALRNVVRHAKTDRAEVVLTFFENTLNLTVSDHGIGMDTDGATPSAGLGLTSMRERARLVNGAIVILSGPGGGTTVNLTVPLQAETYEYAGEMHQERS